MMEGKKISFSFMKTKKQEKPIIEEKKEYIDCVEEKSIKVVGGEVIKDTTPLIIPMKPNTLITADRLKEIAEEVEKAVIEQPEHGEVTGSSEELKPPENESLEQMAIRELIQDTKKEVKVDAPVLTVPIPAQPVLDGQKESTLDDYESVPIQDFGMAMLRGMGWTANSEQSKYKQPQLRPKGLGLGADKVIKENQKKNASKDKDEDLSIVKNAFVKITTGKYNGFYGQVVSLDEDNGRVMVDIAVKKETVSLSEFMMQPVTKSEFDKQSRVINADTYEKYKKNEQMSSKRISSNSPKVSESHGSSSSFKSNDLNRDDKKERHRQERDEISNGRSRAKQKYRRDSTSSDERSRRHKRKDKKRYSSNDSISSSDDNRKHKIENRRHSSSSESDYHRRKHKKDGKRNSTPDKKRDIDKKRKGKKKKRDRDRSPNYKKYRK